MSSTFHLAIEVGDIELATKFYVDILGCEASDEELPNWVDINFWGNELTLHSSDPTNKPTIEAHDVDTMECVLVPHFGVHLDRATYNNLKKRIENSNTEYVLKPFIRFKDKELEQETFFIKDPHCNIMEIKSYTNADVDYPGNPYPWGCP